MKGCDFEVGVVEIVIVFDFINCVIRLDEIMVSLFVLKYFIILYKLRS